MSRSKHLKGPRIAPRPITKGISIVDLIDDSFQSYNAGRLREGAQLFASKMLADDVTVGLTLTGALTPAGLGISTIIPLIEAGFVDWIVSTGANLYHDAHFGLGLAMHRGNAQTSDVALREEGVVRIYDIFFDYEVLLSTDAFFREVIEAPEFQHEMSTAEFHYVCGKYVSERERVLALEGQSLLAAAYRCGVPVHTSSPGDSSIGMNVAAMAMRESKLLFDVNRETRMVPFRGYETWVQITAHDNRHNPVNGVTVRGLWNGANPEVTCVTSDASGPGTCSVVLSSIPNSTRQVSFAVTGMTLSGYTYKSSANHDPDGSSNGFSMTVKRQ